LLKRLTIAAVATLLVLATRSISGAAPLTRLNPGASAPRSFRHPPRGVAAFHAARRRKSKVSWRIDSHGDPAALDNTVGENPAAREAAIDALGDWNGSVVVVDPRTGRILSIVNQKLALESAFTPCSTFKPVVALAGLKEGLITPETRIWISRHARMNLTEALAHSNNPYFSKLGKQLGFARLADYGREFGLGEKTGDGIPGEVPGRFPTEAPKEGGAGFLAVYGRDIEVTPLQLASIISAFANGGTLYELQYPRTTDEIAKFEPKVRRRLDGFADYFPQVRQGLAAAVAYGTARYAYDPQLDIYGKTGTCSENGAHLGWFMSFGEEPQPKYVVVVLLRGGRQMFGPHAAEIAGRVYRDLHQREQMPAPASNPALAVGTPAADAFIR
jgi:penicillin-binding protein 2